MKKLSTALPTVIIERSLMPCHNQLLLPNGFWRKLPTTILKFLTTSKPLTNLKPITNIKG